MEDTLMKVYERTMLSIDVNKVPDIPLIPEIVAVLSNSKDDVDIVNIDGEVTEPVVEPLAAVANIVKRDGDMFTEDSDSEEELKPSTSSKLADKDEALVPLSTPVKAAREEI